MGYILDKNIVFKVSNYLKSSGYSTVFTHGAYDLFHVGHTGFLTDSKKKGDILIVGIESDDRIKRYKDSSRPIIPLVERMRIVAGFKEVDFVFPIEGVNNLHYKYYGSLYQKLSVNKVTFGRNFAYSKQFSIFKKELKHIDFEEISALYDSQSTSRIIGKIIEDNSDLAPFKKYKIPDIKPS